MAYDIQFLDGLVRTTLYGQLTAHDLMEIAKVAAEIETRMEVSPDRLTNMSRVTGVSLDFAAMEAFAAKRRDAPLKNRVKSAIIAPQALQFGFARMYQTLNENPNIELAVFRDEASAVLWLTEVAAVKG